MARTKPLTRQLVEEAIKKTPKAGSRTIAKVLHQQHPAVFVTFNAAYCGVRKARGAHGRVHRKECVTIQTRSKDEIQQCKRWGALLPDAEATDWGWRELPTGISRWLILADLHIPYHHAQNVRAALEYAEGKCDGILLLGDVLDAYQLSSFCRDPRRRNFTGEVETALRFLDALAAYGVKRIVYKIGNHDFRLERYLTQRAPELFPLIADKFSLSAILDLDSRGIELIRAQDPIRHHQLALLHGHEWGNRFASPVNAARGAFLKAHECTLEGHGHRSSYHAETTLFGKTIRCWSVGCLCDMHPEYRPLGNKWDAGFAFLTTGSNWSIENHTIIDGEVY